ncbi:hypothetical protein HY970_00805 [Candidatus Kaiserbacteria bacterium]|nr:hypothetical protein [Candidatus Kaiserbacteria bacterium]
MFFGFLQGLAAGGYVGISIGPLAVWAATLRLRREWVVLYAILIGGTLGDTFVAVVLLFGSTLAGEFLPILAHINHPLVNAAAFTGGGVYVLWPHDAREKTLFKRAGVMGAFGVAFGWNALNADSFIALPALLVMGGITAIEGNIARLAGFVPASYALFWLTIVGFAVFGQRVARERIDTWTNVLAEVGIFFGIFIFVRWLQLPV